MLPDARRNAIQAGRRPINPRTVQPGDRVWSCHNGELILRSKPWYCAGGYAVDVQVPEDRLEEWGQRVTVTSWTAACCNLFHV